MLKLGRIALFAIAVVVALAAVLLLGVNLYVQSQGTQARIQQELSQRLDTTLRIGRISVTPWFGLKLSGITIPQAEGSGTGNFLEAKTFRLRIRFSSLFSERLVIKEVSLVEPVVVWPQNADGKWRLPGESRPPAPSSSPGPRLDSPIAQGSAGAATSANSAAASSAPPPSPPDLATEPEDTKSGRFTPEIRRVQLIGGQFQFLDAKGKLVARFDGVQFRSNFRNAAELRGNASIAKTSLRDRFFLEELRSPLVYDATALEFSQISAHSAGGEITGRFLMQPQAQDSPFQTTVAFHDLQADRLVAQAGGPAGMITGRIEGRLDANGKTSDPNALAGTGEIILRNGVVQQYSLLVALSQLLQIDELRQLQLDQAYVKFHIDPGVVKVDEVLLQSPNLKMTASGTISFEGKLRLDSQLAISEKIRSRLFRTIRENFQPTDDPAFAAVQFDITGTVDRPKTNLMDRLVGQDLKELGRALSGMFGGGDTNRPKKKKKRDRSSDPAQADAADLSPTPSNPPLPTPASPSPTLPETTPSP